MVENDCTLLLSAIRIPPSRVTLVAIVPVSSVLQVAFSVPPASFPLPLPLPLSPVAVVVLSPGLLPLPAPAPRPPPLPPLSPVFVPTLALPHFPIVTAIMHSTIKPILSSKSRQKWRGWAEPSRLATSTQDYRADHWPVRSGGVALVDGRGGAALTARAFAGSRVLPPNWAHGWLVLAAACRRGLETAWTGTVTREWGVVLHRVSCLRRCQGVWLLLAVWRPRLRHI